MANKEIAMIVRFGFSNYLSVREKQDLSLVASSLKDKETGLISSPALQARKLLPVAVIYGANASGKSNIVSAIDYMREAVLFSHSRGDPDGGVNRSLFALDQEYARKPTLFDIDFVIGGTRFHYGFEASDTAYESEWLWAFPSGKRQILFRRELQKFEFGRSLKGQNNVIKDLTRPNSLFVSAAAQNNHEDLGKISSFFRSIALMNDIIEVNPVNIDKSLRNSNKIKRIIDFLERLDTGVIGYQFRDIDLPEEVQIFQRDLWGIVNKLVKERPVPTGRNPLLETTRTSIELAHRGRGGENVFFNLSRESAGTRRLLLLMDAAFTALDKGSPLVIDEFDGSLHTQACEAIIALFSLPQTNPNGSQLITTTHITNLLNPNLLRRDQIWFTEKDIEGATQLYPLTDIRTRQGDNLEKGYLQGRYGAVPIIGDIEDFVIGH
jgi:AAA15 family ATPase/GTPase